MTTSSRKLVSSGSPLEPQIGFSWAVRSGPYVCVAGTAAIADDGSTTAPGDVYRPAYTFAEVSRFIDPDWLVEFEVDAVIPEAS